MEKLMRSSGVAKNDEGAKSTAQAGSGGRWEEVKSKVRRSHALALLVGARHRLEHEEMVQAGMLMLDSASFGDGETVKLLALYICP
jgi:hypothetical protein